VTSNVVAGDVIHTGETRFWPLFAALANHGITIPPERAADIAAQRAPRHPLEPGGWWHRIDLVPPERTHVHPEPVHAFVNAGRWLVQCPRCNGAQFAFQNDPWFLCTDCPDGHVWRTVVWPKERRNLEAELLVRPDRETRSWRLGESIADLVKQNAEHGVG
jgi:hypothetical protein